MATRKILLSPGYGGCWTADQGDKIAERIMLEWEPIVEALEAGEGPLAEDHPAVLSMLEEIASKGGRKPWLGGLDQLEVCEVSGRVRINEYDGYESIEEEGDFDGWL